MIRRLVLCAFALAMLLAACGGDDKASACGPSEPQTIDPSSSQHLFPGAAEPEYTTNPPTSGAHAPGNHPTGVLNEPIAKATQVAMLEAGQVLIQYDTGIARSQIRMLQAIVDDRDDVTVAPNDSLDSPVVATAWLHLMKCTAVEKTALEEFVADHAGRHAGH